MVSDLRSEGLAISAVTLGEFLTGVYRSTDRTQREAALQGFLRRVTVLPFGEGTAARWGVENARLLSAGERITEFDLAIAATALEHGLVLLTENRRHYDRVVGLTLRSVR
jgi:predicted nucleic acid-binding protein